MFDRISFTGLKTSPRFSYAAGKPFFKGRRQLVFKPGLNILFGPNGSCKSTVLRILAGTMCAEQGGLSAVTEASIRANVDISASISRRRKGPAKHQIGLKVEHDGQPVVFIDPRERVGLTGGAFDADFFEQGLAEKLQLSRQSHGEAALVRATPALALLTGQAQFPAEVLQRFDRRVNDVWTEVLALVDAAMAPTIARGQPTILLDEPESNHSLVWQARLWELLARESVANNFQVIVASHSAYALGIKHANYIDFEDGFRAEAEAGLRARFAD
jgi:predicted ATPase